MNYIALARLVPPNMLKKVEAQFVYAGEERSIEEKTGQFIFISFFVSAIISFIVKFFLHTNLIHSFLLILASFFVLNWLGYFFLILKADKRADEVIAVLPDALMLMSANIKSGLTPEKALMMSARPEFGPLTYEINKAIKKTLTGTSFDQALEDMKKGVNSKVLVRTINLLVEGMRAGGEIATLLEETAKDIKSMELLRKEINTSVMMYMIFIFMAAGVAGPFLYSVSLYLTQLIGDFSRTVSMPTELLEQMPISSISFVGAVPEISPDFLMIFTVANVAITCFFGGLIVGLIETGKEKNGIKYIPVLLAISFSIFGVSRLLISRVFGSFFL